MTMKTTVSVKTQFGDHEDSNFSEGLRRSQKVNDEGANCSSKGCGTKEWEVAELRKLEKC